MPDKRQKRRAEIEAVAFRLLATEGFEGTSMKAIAKEARASMETLYNWYGDKQGLFAALVEANAARVLKTLGTVDNTTDAAMARLEKTGRALLSMLTSTEAIALNRAAINDSSGNLGRLLHTSGRATVGPQIATLLKEWQDSGEVSIDDPTEAAATFVNLLVGDHQIRRATHASDALSESDIIERAKRAVTQLAKLYAPAG